ncbi:DoxX family protein [Hymenobacter lucidus]|uniref:DoxX family protein n=1 Tax=Hymenobacter lucidus TaxID=2880930 RepID=A0ABS8ANM9_9BACT|nr:DoxX family protein [Hymenobacter lucidus]MCB2407795.1 DoxX family protein [Hymenobacter lucidus]
MKKHLFSASSLGFRAADAALLLFRLHLGLSIAIGAGWAKLVQLTSATEMSKLLSGQAVAGPPDWFVQQVAELGFTFPSPYLWASLAVWGELVGGLLIALGLFTRLSAVQLAVQFFVIAFLWFDAPAPLLGMYNQQLLFWAFVLVAVVGPGRYSFDYWLMHAAPRRPLSGVPQVAALASLALLLLASAPAVAQAGPNTVTMPELELLARPWPQGTLTYLDYRSNHLVTLPTRLIGQQTAPQELTLSFTYQEPNGQQVQGADQVLVAADGATVTWDQLPMQVTSKTMLPDHTLQLVLEGLGQDNDKPCLIRRTVLLNEAQVSVRKEVKYDGAAVFIIRNSYQFKI